MQPGADNIVKFRSPADERIQIIGLFLAGASLFSLIEDDVARFQIKMLDLMADELQRRVDDYEARKTPS
jgi:hypothetical protein